MSFKPVTTSGGSDVAHDIRFEHCKCRAADWPRHTERAQPRPHQRRLANAEIAADVDVQSITPDRLDVNAARLRERASEAFGVSGGRKATFDRRRGHGLRHLKCLA